MLSEMAEAGCSSCLNVFSDARVPVSIKVSAAVVLALAVAFVFTRTIDGPDRRRRAELVILAMTVVLAAGIIAWLILAT